MQASAATTAKDVPASELAKVMLELWVAINRASGQHVYGVFEELDVSLTHIKTLHCLDAAGEPLAVKEAAEQLRLSFAGTSRAVEALLKRGWVERREDEEDRRVKRLTITPAGRAVLRRIDEARLAGLEDYAARLSPKQRARLTATLKDLPQMDRPAEDPR